MADTLNRCHSAVRRCVKAAVRRCVKAIEPFGQELKIDTVASSAGNREYVDSRSACGPAEE